MEPVPPPDAQTYATDPRIDIVQASVDKLRGSTLEHMHWVNADEPEECVWGFIDAASMLGQAAGMCMPQWRRFLAEEDLTPAFENYRRVVQLLLWKNPVDSDGFLVLKAPQIGRQVAAFGSVFPEADFVITDRDPFRCLVSITVLGESIIDPFCIDNPLTNDGTRDRIVLSSIRPKLAALSAFSAAAPERVTHVAYPALVADPKGTVSRLLSALGLPVDQDLTGRIDAFLHAQQTGARAAPPPQLATMGYDHDDVLSDPVISDYCRTLGIEPERSRLTGTQSSA
jgi:hypothetical protein